MRKKNKIYRVYLDGRKLDRQKEELVSLGDPDGSTYDHNHRLIDCASVLRAIIALTPDGKYTVLRGPLRGKEIQQPEPTSSLARWRSLLHDPTLDLVQGEKQEIPFQGVYRLGVHGGVGGVNDNDIHDNDKGNVRLLTKDLTQPNGLAFSPTASASTWTTPPNATSASTMSVPTEA